MKKATRLLSTALMTAMVVTSSVSVYAATSPVHPVSSQAQQTNANPNYQLVINGTLLSNKQASVYVNQHGVIMVPLRALAEQLDYRVTWNPKTRSVEVT